MSVPLTPIAFWTSWSVATLSNFFEFSLEFILRLKLRESRLFVILVICLNIHILNKLLELSSNVRFKLWVLIFKWLIFFIILDFESHILALASLPFPINFIKRMVSKSFDSSTTVILVSNYYGRDLRIFLTILGSRIFSPKLNARFIMSLSLA